MCPVRRHWILLCPPPIYFSPYLQIVEYSLDYMCSILFPHAYFFMTSSMNWLSTRACSPGNPGRNCGEHMGDNSTFGTKTNKWKNKMCLWNTMPPIMANSNEGQDHKDKYFYTSRKILSKEMTMCKMEALVSYFSEVMTNVNFFF